VDKERLTERLHCIARERAISAGFLFGEDTARSLHEVIDEAVARIEKEGKLEDAVANMEAKSNLMRLIDAMAQEARKTPEDSDTNELHPHNYNAAMEKLRPLWPFC